MVIKMKKTSIWSEEIKCSIFPKLNSDIDVDVLIIGGGITGINTLYHLVNNGLSVCLVEKNLLGSGVTCRTTGKLTYLQGDIYSKIKENYGLEKAKLYFDSQIEAVKLATSIIKNEQIDCNFEKVDSYVFVNSDNSILRKEQRLLEGFGIKTQISNKLPCEEKKVNGFYITDSYVYHPIKYIKSLANICKSRGASIYENTKIISIKHNDNKYFCKTKTNIIKAKHVILAVHYPYFLKPLWMPFKCYLEKSYIEAFRTDTDYKFSAISIDKPTISIRYYNNNDDTYELFLGESHNLAVKNNEEQNFQNLLNEKSTKPSYLWSNKDIMTIDSLPFIGKIDDNGLLIGTGYNTWGMTNGILAGKIICDIILKKENKYIDLFNPYRNFGLSILKNGPLILGSNSLALIKTKVKKNKSWYSDCVKFERRDGKDIAIYIDENKKEHIVYNICPHMKCNLIFNEVEKTWDCPCHGSRFDVDGKCIEGPSNYDISYKK